jgi:hypothetical protein
MKKLRSIMLLVITAVLLSGLSSFAGYRIGLSNGFNDGFKAGWKVGFIMGARQLFTAITGRPGEDLQVSPDKALQDK